MSPGFRKFWLVLGTLLVDIVILMVGISGSVYFFLGPSGCGIEGTCTLKGNSGSIFYLFLTAAIGLATLAALFFFNRGAIRSFRAKHSNKTGVR